MTIMSAGESRHILSGVGYIRACRLVYHLPISVRLRLARNLGSMPIISGYTLHTPSLQAKYDRMDKKISNTDFLYFCNTDQVSTVYISTDRKLYNFISYRNFTSIIVSNSKR